MIQMDIAGWQHFRWENSLSTFSSIRVITGRSRRKVSFFKLFFVFIT